MRSGKLTAEQLYGGLGGRVEENTFFYEKPSFDKEEKKIEIKIRESDDTRICEVCHDVWSSIKDAEIDIMYKPVLQKCEAILQFVGVETKDFWIKDSDGEKYHMADDHTLTQSD